MLVKLVETWHFINIIPFVHIQAWTESLICVLEHVASTHPSVSVAVGSISIIGKTLGDRAG